MYSYTPTPDYYRDYISHHGVLGMKWGKRNGPPYPLSSDISTGKKLKTTFVSGSSKTQFKDSPYYQKKLSKSLRKELDDEMKAGNKIIVGDAPGIDRQVQDYLKKKKYKNVEVYSPGKESRYLADKTWKNNLVDDPKHEPMSPEWLAKKDKVMAKVADKGIAVILDEGSKATKNNIERLLKDNKEVSVYQIDPHKKGYDKINYSEKMKKQKYTNNVFKSSSYTKDFLNFVKSDIGKPESVDDYELMELIIMEYEDSTGKKATKGNWRSD